MSRTSSQKSTRPDETGNRLGGEIAPPGQRVVSRITAGRGPELPPSQSQCPTSSRMTDEALWMDKDAAVHPSTGEGPAQETPAQPGEARKPFAPTSQTTQPTQRWSDNEPDRTVTTAPRPTGSHAAVTHDPALPVIEGYEILHSLGQGGMGTVYAARDLMLAVTVALKIPTEQTTAYQERFLSEAQCLAKVQHRNVVGIRNFGRSGSHVFFSMPLIDGPSAASMIKAFRQHSAYRCQGRDVLALASVNEEVLLPELREAAGRDRAYYRMVALWIAGAAEGLHAAHASGILHRDVKPANMLLASDGRLMMADFGLAITNDDLTGRACGISGTRPYVAPERISGDQARIDHRADQWALGATLYEFLTFRRAYVHDGTEVLQDIATKDPVPPRRLLSRVPKRLEEICLKAMRRDPAARYANCDEMAADLRAFANGVTAWKRRAVVAAVVLVAAMLFTGAMIYVLSKMNREGDLRPSDRRSLAEDPKTPPLTDAPKDAPGTKEEPQSPPAGPTHPNPSPGVDPNSRPEGDSEPAPAVQPDSAPAAQPAPDGRPPVGEPQSSPPDERPGGDVRDGMGDKPDEAAPAPASPPLLILDSQVLIACVVDPNTADRKPPRRWIDGEMILKEKVFPNWAKFEVHPARTSSNSLDLDALCEEARAHRARFVVLCTSHATYDTKAGKWTEFVRLSARDLTLALREFTAKSEVVIHRPPESELHTDARNKLLRNELADNLRKWLEGL